ncbi:MAG: lysylphosphatidylglycerol synthase transmembrane domain-containing protein [Actinobacteria bacterium]|nr:lysylphosphatidylglycerol synthase transmembrane domain-containing protein [Actinomycetota bacterium]
MADRAVRGAPGAPPEAAVAALERRRWPLRVIVLRVAFLVLALIGLYVVWPSLMDIVSSWPRLRIIEPGWYAAMVAAVVGSFFCVWVLYRVVLHVRSWFVIGASQLASSAFGRIVPGGAASAGALQYQMLVQAGARGGRVATGITAVSIISAGTILALPLFAIPLFFGAIPLESTLRRVALLGLGMLIVAVAFAVLVLATDKPLAFLGRVLDRLSALIRRKHPRPTGFGERILHERDVVRSVLGRAWWQALIAALGQRAFDFAALLLALYASGARVSPLLVLLAYAVAQILMIIPITPGGIGFVELGLVGFLGLAGVEAGPAVLATLAYRLVSYWLPLPIGAGAYAWFSRRYGSGAHAAVPPPRPS